MREMWTDERLDGMSGRTADGFNRVDTDLRKQHREMRAEFVAVRSETRAEFVAVRSEMRAEFDSLKSRFYAMQLLMIQIGGGITIAIFVAGFVSLLLIHH